jgi:pimeloyl-ACP methyl ester carboxylesterase
VSPSDADVDGYLEPLLLDGTESALADMVRSSTVMQESAFRALSVPVYGIWGEKDSWVPLEEAYRLQAALPSIEIEVIPGAGHCPMETHSEVWNRLLINALNSAEQ